MPSTAPTSTAFPTVTVQREPSAACQPHPIPVSDVSCVTAELDRVIQELGRRTERAMADGDPQGARLYVARMYAAIASRTPEHQARMEAEIQDRITNGVDYFQSPHALGMARGEAAKP